MSPSEPTAEHWAADLRCATPSPVAWVWHGFLAAGFLTQFTSRWKAGKTTLLSVLLAKMGYGGTLAGRAVTAGKAVVVSEETPQLWASRVAKLGIGEHVCFLCRPFLGKPDAAGWLALIDRIRDLHARHGLSLAVIDPISAFLPGRNESNAAAVTDALAPLRRLTDAGLAVLLLHHPRKAGGLDGRGSGAFDATADILIQMDMPRDTANRRRRLHVQGRPDDSTHAVEIELTADGTDYTVVTTDPAAEEFDSGWTVLQMVLEDADYKLSRQEVLAQWPADFDRPHAVTLARWLERGVAAGMIMREGTGRRTTPFRYWLPGRENLSSDLVELASMPPLERRTWFRLAREVLRRTAPYVSDDGGG